MSGWWNNLATRRKWNRLFQQSWLPQYTADVCDHQQHWPHENPRPASPVHLCNTITRNPTARAPIWHVQVIFLSSIISYVIETQKIGCLYYDCHLSYIMWLLTMGYEEVKTARIDKPDLTVYYFHPLCGCPIATDNFCSCLSFFGEVNKIINFGVF